MSITHSTSQVSIADLRANLRTLMESVKTTHARYTITNNGQPEAVLISFEELAALEETLDILSDPEEMAAIRQGQAELDRGEGIPLEQVLREEADRRKAS